jgi:hypothetical protein
MLAEPVQYLRLDLEIKVPYHIVLDGLDAWFEWELISEMDFRWRNKKLSANRLTVVARQNDAILQGLDLWLELGLITEESVKLICQTRLVCELKSRVTEPALSGQVLREARPNRPLTNTASLPRSTVATATVKAPQPPNKVAQTLRSLFSEFSTMWLLFLGVFLVVVSSGLLAASQWDNFSAEMQYLLLLAYTLGFFGVSFWTSQNEQLRMTTRALQLVTLLLVPANFWAMDGLGLLKNPAGLGLSAIAGGLLSWIAVFLLQSSFRFQESQAVSEDAATNQARRRTKKQLSQISILAILVLDWLHLGWFVSPYYPLIAVYLGIGAIATSTFVNRRQGLNTVDSSTFPLALITGAYSTVLLVSRALLFGSVSIFKLGLAFGICGWVLVQITNKATQLNQRSVDKTVAQKAITPTAEHPSILGFQASLGKILLGLGWFVSVWDQYPWQTLAISLLIAWMICDRLFKKEEPTDLGYAFLWGLQIIWLVQRLIPADWTRSLTQQLLTLLQTPSEVSLLGTVLFPYLIVTLVIAAIYRDRQKQELANTAELLALGFGVLLTVISIGYASTIFINLALSAVTLLILQARRADTSKDLHSLVYFTHIVSLSAIISGVYFFTRSTSTFTWVGFLLGATLIEWSAVLAIGKFNAVPQSENHHLQAWRDSAWHIGASLAALSYILLWNVSLIGRAALDSSELVTASYWGVSWLCVPISLTFLGTWREFADRDLAIKLSIAGLLLAQFLTWGGDGSRIIGLGIAFALMLVNTRRSESLLTAFNTVGYGLLFIASLLWQFKSNDGTIAQFTFWTNGMVFSAILLYVLNHWLKYRRERHVANLNLTLNQSYSQAFDIWAALISAALLILQTYLAMSVLRISFWFGFGFAQGNELFVSLLPSTLLVTLGLVYRMWQEAADKIPAWTLWSIAWSVEILAAGTVSFAKGGIIELAIANIGLGFFTQLLGDWWIQRKGIREYPRSWDFIPLIYGAIGSLLRLSIFSSITGLFSLGTALICIGIGRRSADSNPNAKSLIYFSMGLITFSAYELLFYQMLRNSQGGSLGDALVILAALGCAIAYAYKLFANGLHPYLKISHRAISTFAHLHWSVSIVFLLLGILFSPSTNGGIIGAGIATALSVYAIVQARKSHLTDSAESSAELWTYTGLATAIGAIGYLIYFAFPNAWLIVNILQPYAAAIACMVTVILYILPWEEWGWIEQPWHNSAFALPLIFIFITATAIATPCLIFVGAFYAIYAKLKSQIRATYITVFLWDWVFFKTVSFANYGWFGFSLLSNVIVIGLSGLYFAQVEPNLRSQDNRDVRHFLRSLCSGGMGLVAFFYSLDNPNIALTTWILSIVFILAGLALRVRAYLFMGTLTFVLLVITQAVILVTQYSFLMWALGIIAGIGFILVAANFEVRRDRILALFRSFAIELETWE